MLSDPNLGKSRTPEYACRPGVALFELLSAIAFLEVAIWTAIPEIRMTSGIVFATFAFRLYIRYARHVPRPKQEQVVYGSTLVLFSLALAVVITGISYALGVWIPSNHFFSQRSMVDWATVKIPTVVLQQFLFQLIFIPTIFCICNNRKWTIVLAATLFGFLHIPNPLLVLLTLTIGVVWFSFCFVQPRLISLTCSHLILAVVVANVAEEYVLDMRVGEVCFQKWPKTVTGASDNQFITVYPRVIEGEIQGVTQHARKISITGNVFDSEKNRSPKTVYVVLGSFDPDDEEGTSWQPEQIRSTSRIQPDGVFFLELAAPLHDKQTEVRVFVRHEFGWCYPVNDSARVELLAHDRSGESIRLFPKEFHGNIGHIKHRPQRTDLIGWGFAMQKRHLLESLLVFYEDRFHAVTLERRERKEIANYYSDPSLLLCGFISRVPFPIEEEKPAIYLRNSNGELERMPMELAQPQKNRLSNIPKKIR